MTGFKRVTILFPVTEGDCPKYRGQVARLPSEILPSKTMARCLSRIFVGLPLAHPPALAESDESTPTPAHQGTAACQTASNQPREAPRPEIPQPL